ncbi:large neutral amino acids transporter small subunit 1-like [Centruroides sculpturatus]|uniref:large neutral amino acids transporter small subunit 1-like n=1 Tax=Centruroides sculpturatus TaxID=218467 RepID=UPI000C6E5B9F|nr:large neutral amino acids transporter small subunit 1-like [Centruroides sculpturatus]
MAPEGGTPAEMEKLNYDSKGKGSGIHLKKELGVLNGVAIIVGIIVGSGIFVSPRGVLNESGSIGLALLIWVLCGVLCMLGALCYAELGTSIPKSGGDYAYIYEAFGPIFSFLFLWVAMLIIMPTGNAIAALTFANYILEPFFPSCNPPANAVRLIAALVVSFLTFINCYNVKWATKVQVGFTFAKIIALVVIIFTGMIHLAQGNLQNFDRAFEGTTTEPGYIALAFYSGLFSYSGWNYLNFVTEEMKNPFRNLPRAIYISLPMVTIIYVLANVAYFAVLTSSEVLSSNAVAVMLNLAIRLKHLLLFYFRLFFVGARQGHLPRALAMININHVTPTPSLIFLGILTLAYLSTTQVYVLITYTSFVESAFITLSVAGMLKLRFSNPDMQRPIKVNILIPVIFLLVCMFLVVLPFYVSPLETGVGIGITLTGIPVYFLGIYWKNKPPFLQKFLDNFTKSTQKLMLSIPQDDYSD